MKNAIKVLLTFALTVMVLTSCFSTQSGSGDSGNINNNQTGVNGWSAGAIICYEGDEDVAFDNLKSRFRTELRLQLFPDKVKEDACTFIVGRCDNSASQSAYAAMDKHYDHDQYNTSYVIYSDGSSIAIAYDSLVARWAAIDYFLTEFDNLDLTSVGPLAMDEFEILSFVNEKREQLRDDGFTDAANYLSEGAVASLKNIYSLYDEEVYLWLANLWCPDRGGFYYSNSARNFHGFLPDLESTAQALLFMSDSGMLSEYDGKYRYALPTDMADSILSFAKGCQDSDDGYFYHKQWGTSISSTRRGRDLGWATRIISGLGSVPYYDTPNGVKGQPSDSAVSEASLTASLKRSAVTAVSMVINVASPSYLKSVELFKEHLENDFDWEKNSYAAGNALESELGQIQAKDKQFKDSSPYATALISFLNSKQKSNGLWEDEVTYDSVNGLMKISVVYTSLKAPIPRLDLAMECAIQMLKSDTVASHVCSVYNPWEAVANILASVERASDFSEVNRLREGFREQAQELISITLEKLLSFKKQDGGFSYYLKYSAANSQGSPVAVQNTPESDVNATMICVNSLITAMFDVFGIEEVARYGPVDFAYFSDIVNSLGTIIKNEIPETELITFDDYDINYSEEKGGVVLDPVVNVTNVIGDKESSMYGEYIWFESGVTRNPAPNAAADDMVLHVKSNVCVGEEKSLADKASSTRFKMTNALYDSIGDCYVYDADMYFVSGYGKTNHEGKKTSDPLLQLFFMTDSYACSGVNFSVYSERGIDYVKIGEAYGGLDGKNPNVAGGIPMDEWVNIRLEFYKNYREDINGTRIYEPVLKVYVNGRYQGECDANVTGTDSSGQMIYYDRDISLISVSYYRYLASEVYFNDVLVERCDIKYVQETNPNEIVDPPTPDEEMRESYGFEDGLLNTSNVVNKVRVYDFGVGKYINASEGQTYNPSISYSITADPADAANRVLKVVALKSNEFDKPSRTEVNLYNSDADGTNYIFSGRFYYSSADIGVKGDLTQIFIMNSADGQAYSIRINALWSGGKFTLSLIENNKGNQGTGTGATIATGIECDKWFTLKIVFHGTKDKSTTGADIYLNGKWVYTDTTYMPAALQQSPLVKVAIVHQKNNKSTLYLDDLSYAKSGEVIEETESDERVATFTEGFNTKYLNSYSYSLDGSEELDVDDISKSDMDNLYTKFYLSADPTGAANQVLKAVNKNGGTKPGYTRVNISNEKPSGDCYTFETKMYAETYKAGYNFACIKFMDANGEVAYSVYVSIDSNTNNIKVASTGSGIYPAAGTNLLEDSDVSVEGKKWFTLRMELYHQGKDATAANTYLKLYINDTLAYSGAAYKGFGAEIRYVKIEHCKTKQSSAIYYDDISFTRTNKEYEKN